MSSVLITTLLPTLLGAALPQPQDQPNRKVLQIIPLQHVCSSYPAIQAPLWISMLVRPYDDEERLDLLHVGGDETQQFSPDTVIAFLQGLNEDDIGAERLSLEAGGGALYAMGEDASIARLRTQIRELSAIVTRPLEIEVAFWRAGDGAAPAAVMSADEYSRFADSHELLWRRNTTTRSGRAAALESTRWTNYVRDVAVEIASKSAISHPTTSSFFEGAHVVVHPHGLVGSDDFVLQVQFTWSERQGAVARVATGIPDSAQLDQPRLGSACGGCSGRVQNGGALVATMRGDDELGAACIMTARVSSRVATVARQANEIGVFPISALLSTALLDRIGPTDSGSHCEDPRESEFIVSEASEGYGQIEADRILHIAHMALGEAEEETSLQVAGGYLWVSGTGEAAAKTEQLLRSLQERLLRNATVGQTLQFAAANDGRQGAPAAGPLHEIVLPTLLGRYATATRRSEISIVKGLNVEVAEEASATDPTVGVLQTGSWLRARVVLIDDQAHLSLSARNTHCQVPETRQMIPAGALKLPSVAEQNITFDGTATSGRAIRHGDGPTIEQNGGIHRSEVVTTVRW